ncbi:MAG: glycosyl hydrolase [Bacteroidetes bacterium]|nr:glycosyl hydrolase [Bacteroidota bacterium]
MRTLLFLFCAFTTCILNAQHTNIKVSATGVSGSNEPAITLDPKAPNRLVVASNNFYAQYTTDTGHTWTSLPLSCSYDFAGDPTLVVDTDGVFYLFHLAGQYNTPGWLDRLICQKSYDGGITWTDGTYLGYDSLKDQDKQWVVIDRNTNHLYVTWTQFDTYGSLVPTDSTNILFSKSTDTGFTWTTPIRINDLAGNCYDDDTSVEGAVPTIGPNGELYVSWSDIEGIKFDKSTDGGFTWGADVLAATQPGGWVMDIPGIQRCNGLPITECDRSNSPYKGHIYINWADQRNGSNDVDIWISKSVNQGQTWSTPKRVNDDVPGKHQFFTWMTLDQANGTIYIVYYDRRNDNTNINKTDVYLAVSKDGGQTFMNQKISDTSFIPNANIFFGDYINITANNNIVRPIWTRMVNGSRSLWTALVNPDLFVPAGVPSESAKILDFAVFPNPVTNKLSIALNLNYSSQIEISLRSLTGEKIATLFDARHVAGHYQLDKDISALGLATGLYLMELKSEKEHKICKVAIR